MPRPSRKGLDYFPLDTTILNDIKVRRIKRQFGADAFLLYISLLCDIYSNGYYIEATDDYLFDQGEKLGIAENKVLEILLACVKIGLFNNELFMENRILTSKSIQERFSLATKKRADNQVVEYKCGFVSAPETPVSVSETPSKQGLSTQSKVKNSKVTTTATTRARERKKSNVFFSFPIFLLFSSFSYLYRIITGKHVYKKNNARTICIRCTLYFQRHSLCPRESISQKGRRHHPFSETP